MLNGFDCFTDCFRKQTPHQHRGHKSKIRAWSSSMNSCWWLANSFCVLLDTINLQHIYYCKISQDATSHVKSLKHFNYYTSSICFLLWLAIWRSNEKDRHLHIYFNTGKLHILPNIQSQRKDRNQKKTVFVCLHEECYYLS